MPVVRRYRPADHPDLMRFLADVFGVMGRQFQPDAKDADIRHMDAVYLADRGAFFVVDADGAIGGSVGIRRCSDHIAELKRLYVDGALRGKGLGFALSQAAIDEARSLGYASVRLDTTAGSAVALALFEKLGFRGIERYNADPFAEIFMQLDL